MGRGSSFREHHQRAVDRLVAHFKADSTVRALIIGGSLVKGLAAENSDIDFMAVTTDEEFARRLKTKEYQFYSEKDFCDYPEGYVDGKFMDLQFLKDVADRGSEPARWAFSDAVVAFSEIPELDGLLRKIPVYPEHERDEKIRSFHCQVCALAWFATEAEKRNDRYLMTHVVADLVLFAGRLILAHNRMLYPYHKWFMHVLDRAPEKPDNLMERIDSLLSRPSKKHAEALRDSVFEFRDWGIPAEGWPSRFMEDNEWNWREGKPPVEDW